jgi:sulfur carrier protein ThiS
VHVQLKVNSAGESRHVPAERTVHDILNRLGYRRRPVRKTKPKKIRETDAIFDPLRQVDTQAAENPETLRISLDTKAKVKIGAFS